MEPGLDNAPIQELVAVDGTNIGLYYEYFGSSETTLLDKWSGFRGASRDNINVDGYELTSSINNKNILWEKVVGEGHSGAAIDNGLIYLLDYDEFLKKEFLRCFDLITGAELWRVGYNLDIKRNHGFTRTVPAVLGDYIVTIGVEGHVMCISKNSGELIWGMDLKERYNSIIPGWYTAQCPLLTDRGTLILAPSGSVLMLEVDLATGDILWETDNTVGFDLSHSSVVPMELSGKKMFVYSAIGGTVGVSAEKNSRGELLWSKSWFPAVVAPSPIQVSGNRIFLTSGYGSGSRLLEVNYISEEWNVDVLFDKAADEGLACEQQTPILYKDRLYSILPKDARSLREQFVSSDLNGEIISTTGNQYTFGLGPFILADNKFYVLKDSGELFIIEPETCNIISSFKVLDGHDAWAPIAIAGEYMVLRDSKTLKCLYIGVSDEL